MTDQSRPGPEAGVCALAGCGEPVVQPAGGGRRRLYCSNAHRAEARRRRLADSPQPAPGELLSPALERLGAVLTDLRGYEATLRSIDPGRQAVEIARVRAEATAEVLAAQQNAANVAEAAARTGEQLAAERTAWEREHSDHEAAIAKLRAEVSTARDRAASTQDALDAALTAHRADLDRRDLLAAQAAAAHEDEIGRLSEQLDQTRTAVSAAKARADAADQRAAHAEDAYRKAAQHAAETEASMNRLRVDMANAHAAEEAATVRADTAERLLDQARTELQTERNRYDVSLSQLHDQLAQLIARNPPRRAPTKTTAKRPAPSS
ncbi:MAG: hypothetical protein QOF30_845 [Acidimicrobiaceae bacterium]|nr:hypothetical protein [Acidimicrobiaceae bacterium]